MGKKPTKKPPARRREPMPTPAQLTRIGALASELSYLCQRLHRQEARQLRAANETERRQAVGRYMILYAALSKIDDMPTPIDPKASPETRAEYFKTIALEYRAIARQAIIEAAHHE